MKDSQMGFVFRNFMNSKALRIVLSEIINILRHLQQNNKQFKTFQAPPPPRFLP